MYSERMLMGEDYCRTCMESPDCECLDEECVEQEEILSSTDISGIS